MTREPGPATRLPVVVLDLDDVLCTIVLDEPEDIRPECLRVPFVHEGHTWTHVFVPYVDVLLRTLPAWGVRVAFFSSGAAERNHPVIGELVLRALGPEAAARAREQGQFAIHSNDDLRPSVEGTVEDGINVKDLLRVIRPGEALDDAILVEDQPSYAAAGQRPCLQAMALSTWHPSRGESGDVYAANGVAWILGVLDALLHEPRFALVPMRLALESLLAETFAGGGRPNAFWPDAGQNALVVRGLALVRQEVPEAIFHGLRWMKGVSPEGALHRPEAVHALLDRWLAAADPPPAAAGAFLDQIDARSDLAGDEGLREKVRRLRAGMDEG